MSQPIIAEATSGRSKCKACVYLGPPPGETAEIAMGSKRVGIPGHAAGVTVYHWCKPACFAKHCLTVDRAPTGSAKCKADGSQIPKGSTRLLVGYKKEASKYRIENVRHTIVPELIALVGRSKVVVHGLDALSLDERQRVEGLIFDDGAGASGASSRGSGKPGSTRTAAAPSAGPARKRDRKADAGTAPAPKNVRRAKKRVGSQEEEESDTEVCD